MTCQACCPYCLKPVFDNGKEVMDYCLNCDIELNRVMHVSADNGSLVLPERIEEIEIF